MEFQDTPSLVRRAQKGDADAFDALVYRFQDRMVAYAHARTQNRQTAEEVAQEAFLQAYRSLPKLVDPAAFPAWLRRITFKCAHREWRRRTLTTIALETVPEVSAPSSVPEENQVLTEAIAGLPPGERTVLLLHYVGGSSQADIASFLSLSPATVRKRMERARARLKERMLIMAETVLRETAPSRDKRFVEKARLLRRIVDVLEADTQVAAAYLARFGEGSDGLDTNDDGWNALNLHVVLADDSVMDTLAKGRLPFVRRVAEPFLYEEAAQNAPPQGYYLMALYEGEAGPYEVDWYWHPRTNASLPTESRLLFDRVGLPQSAEPTPWGCLTDEQIPRALRDLWARRTTNEARAEEGRNLVSLFWAMEMIAGKAVARHPTATTLAHGGMLCNLRRDLRVLLGEPFTPNTPDPTLPSPQAKLDWLRTIGQELERDEMPRLAALGAEIPLRAPGITDRFLEQVAESLPRS